MPSDRTYSGTPDADVPAAAGALRAPSAHEVPGTLASELVPVVDDLRELNAEFGIRPYRVFLVHTQWSGESIGRGSPVEIARREIEPIPRVADMNATTAVLRSVGLAEEGGLTVSEISPRFTEDDLMGRTPDLQDPTLPATGLPNVEFYWEVVENRPSQPPSERRRYVPNAAPSLSRDGFEWRVQLAKQDANRARNGSFSRAGA